MIIFFITIFTLALIVSLVILSEIKIWNKGKCKKCNTEWVHFDTCGGIGYRCACDDAIWISYLVFKKNKKCSPMGNHECCEPIKNIDGKGKNICADKCLIPAIKKLWKAGFVTLASCCGHGKIEGRIDFKKEANK